MKVHNASNENASVTLKPAEIEEITTIGFDFKKMSQQLLEIILDNFDNGENCPSCGREYDETVTLDNERCGIFCGSPAKECAIIMAQEMLDKYGSPLAHFRLACLDLGSVDTFYQPLDLK